MHTIPCKYKCTHAYAFVRVFYSVAVIKTLEKALMFDGYECVISIWREWKSRRNVANWISVSTTRHVTLKFSMVNGCQSVSKGKLQMPAKGSK